MGILGWQPSIGEITSLQNGEIEMSMDGAVMCHIINLYRKDAEALGPFLESRFLSAQNLSRNVISRLDNWPGSRKQATCMRTSYQAT